MSKDGDNNGRGKGEGEGGQRQVPRPPTNIDDAKKIHALERRVQQLTALLQNRSMPEGPMDRDYSQPPVSYEDDAGIDGLIDELMGDRCEDPQTIYARMWEAPSFPMEKEGTCGQEGAIDPSLMVPEGCEDEKSTSKFRKVLGTVYSSITKRPVASFISPVVSLVTLPFNSLTRAVRVGMGAALLNAGFAAREAWDNFTLGTFGRAFGSNAKGAYDFVAEKATSIEMSTLASFGTVASYVCAASCALSTVFNASSLKKMADRLSSSVLFLGLPSIVSDASGFLGSGAQATLETLGRFADSLGSASSLALFGFVSLRMASYLLPDSVPFASRVKKLLDKRKEAKSSQDGASGQKEPGRIMSAVYGAADAVASPFRKLAGRLGASRKPSIYPSIMDSGRRPSAPPRARVYEDVADARNAWEAGCTVSQDSEDAIVKFLGKVSMGMNPHAWLPVLAHILNTNVEGDDAREQAFRIVRNTGVFNAMNKVSVTLSNVLFSVLSADPPEEEVVRKMNIDALKGMYNVLEAYDMALGGSILKEINVIPDYIDLLAEAQQGQAPQQEGQE